MSLTVSSVKNRVVQLVGRRIGMGILRQSANVRLRED